ncbi:MAG: hypothetical protein ACKVXR_17455 [Planctomycetota bacterium]
MATETKGPATPPTEPGGPGIPRSSPVLSGRERWGWVATIAGLVVILAGVLNLTSATVGGRVREFKERRTYTEVKLATHRAIPLTALLGFAGMGLVFFGSKLRASGRKADRSE